MVKSTNTLFHFTSAYSTLESILINKFYPSYCKELIYYKERTEFIIVPMVSFCDIPLSSIKNINYGSYGLGLSKEWAIEKRLNPVLYIEKNSLLAESFLKSMDGMYEPYRNLCIIEEKLKKINLLGHITNQEVRKAIDDKRKEANEQRNNIIDSIRFTIYSAYFTKHYQDDLERDGLTYPNYDFYNEREWRFVPSFDSEICKFRMTEEQFNDWRGASEEKKPLLTDINLSFTSKDINYIIVNSKDEIQPMIQTIENCTQTGKLSDIKELLISKIITHEQLVRDC